MPVRGAYYLLRGTTDATTDTLRGAGFLMVVGIWFPFAAILLILAIALKNAGKQKG
jgi:hypothetical protein